MRVKHDRQQSQAHLKLTNCQAVSGRAPSGLRVWLPCSLTSCACVRGPAYAAAQATCNRQQKGAVWMRQQAYVGKAVLCAPVSDADVMRLKLSTAIHGLTAREDQCLESVHSA